MQEKSIFEAVQQQAEKYTGNVAGRRAYQAVFRLIFEANVIRGANNPYRLYRHPC